MLTIENSKEDKAGWICIRRPNKIKDMKLVSWNVLSLYRPGTLKMLLDEILKYKIDIACIQEVRCIRSGTIKKRDWTIFYSCHRKEHIQAFGFIISRRI